MTNDEDNDNLRTVKQPAGPSFHRDYIETYKQNLLKDDRFNTLINTIATAAGNNTNLITQRDIDTWIDLFNDMIISNATTSFPQKKKPRFSPNQRNKARTDCKPARWYDDECKKAKGHYKRLTNQIRGFQ